MKVLLERFGFGRNSTLGALWLDTELVGFVIEDERRKAKVLGETCIPAGTYSLAFRHEGGFHERYAKQFYRIPMAPDSVRSLNLSTSVGVVLYEAIRQTGALIGHGNPKTA